MNDTPLVRIQKDATARAGKSRRHKAREARQLIPRRGRRHARAPLLGTNRLIDAVDRAGAGLEFATRQLTQLNELLNQRLEEPSALERRSIEESVHQIRYLYWQLLVESQKLFPLFWGVSASVPEPRIGRRVAAG